MKSRAFDCMYHDVLSCERHLEKIYKMVDSCRTVEQMDVCYNAIHCLLRCLEFSVGRFRKENRIINTITFGVMGSFMETYYTEKMSEIYKFYFQRVSYMIQQQTIKK